MTRRSNRWNLHLMFASGALLAGVIASACSSDAGGENATPPAGSDGGAGADTGTTANDGAPADAPASTNADADAKTEPPMPFTPPYALPTSGHVLPIPTTGRNVAVDVKPPPHDNGSWQYSLFQSYGGGSFSADYSQGGAYVIAGSGGHGAPSCFGAAMFDFTTATWSYLPNANGFDENHPNDIDRTTETNNYPYLELTATTKPEMPSPDHHYLLQISPPKSVLAGARGAVLKVVSAATTTNGWDSPQSHQIDLATGLWKRASTNLVTAIDNRTPYTDTTAAYDPTTKRVYFVLGEIQTTHSLPYLDLTDLTWKNAGYFPEPDGSGYATTAFIDDQRRLLLIVRGSGELWAINLDDVPSGVVKLNVSGTVPTEQLRWELYPTADGGDGSFYSLSGRGAVYDQPPFPQATLQALYKLTPPTANPLTGTWTFSTVPIDGGITAEYVTDPGSGAHHASRFFYVPALHTFAWIPNGTGPVELIKP